MQESNCPEGSTVNPRCSCALGGYLRGPCVPLEHAHRWAIDRLLKEFYPDQVRVSWPTDYGRHQGVAVSLDGWKTGSVWTLTGRHPEDMRNDVPRDRCRWYDLNDNRPDLDLFLQRIKEKRGFGQQEETI